jgi:uncharacterized membrane protein YsdA (DUF1294 family)
MTRSRFVYRSPVLLQTSFTLATILVAVVLCARFGIHWLWAYLIAINLATLAIYAYDKSAAIVGWTRIPETTLHLFELFGGTPAAFAAQVLLHHKNRKTPFQIRFWLIFLIQVGLLILLRGHAW